jgi:hypothetical protein
MTPSSLTAQPPKFASSFLDAVHGGLGKVLGVSGTTSVLSHMKMLEDLPDAAKLHSNLVTIFGKQGTVSLERAIVKDLATRMKWSHDSMKTEGAFDFKATVASMESGVRVSQPRKQLA